MVDGRAGERRGMDRPAHRGRPGRPPGCPPTLRVRRGLRPDRGQPRGRPQDSGGLARPRHHGMAFPDRRGPRGSSAWSSVEGHRSGTGLLIGPDLVLTVPQLFEPVHGGELHSNRGDGRLGVEGGWTTARCGTPGSRSAWPTIGSWGELRGGVSAGPPGPAYAVIRLAGNPGLQPVGWPRAEPSAAPRGWFSMEPGPSIGRGPARGDPLFGLSYLNSKWSGVTLDPRAVLGVGPSGSLVRGVIPSPPAPSSQPPHEAVALIWAGLSVVTPRGGGGGVGPDQSAEGSVERSGDEGVASMLAEYLRRRPLSPEGSPPNAPEVESTGQITPPVVETARPIASPSRGHDDVPRP